MPNTIKQEKKLRTTRIDYDASNNPIYVGRTFQTGVATSDAKWQIIKITWTGVNPTLIERASGNDNYDKVWDDRATISFS